MIQYLQQACVLELNRDDISEEIIMSQNTKKKKKIPVSEDIRHLWEEMVVLKKETSRLFDKLDKNDKRLDKNAEKLDKKFDERQKKSDEKFAEMQRKSSEEFAEMQRISNEKFAEGQKKLDKSINKIRGTWRNDWGDFVASLIDGCLVKLLKEWNIQVNCTLKELKTDSCEIDIVAINTDTLVATEVKSTITVDDIKYFLKKIESFTEYFPQ